MCMCCLTLEVHEVRNLLSWHRSPSYPGVHRHLAMEPSKIHVPLFSQPVPQIALKSTNNDYIYMYVVYKCVKVFQTSDNSEQKTAMY